MPQAGVICKCLGEGVIWVNLFALLLHVHPVCSWVGPWCISAPRGSSSHRDLLQVPQHSRDPEAGDLAPELKITLSREELTGSSTSCVVWLSTPKPKMIQLLLAVGTVLDSNFWNKQRSSRALMSWKRKSRAFQCPAGDWAPHPPWQVVLWSCLATSPFITFLWLQESSRAGKGCDSERAGILNLQIISWHRVSEAISAQGRDWFLVD